MTTLQYLKNLNVETSKLSLWVFKKQSRKGYPPKFTGRWIETSESLEGKLKSIVDDKKNEIEETENYSLLAQNNEGSALVLPANETHVGLVIDAVAAETLSTAVGNLKELHNTVFYVIKLVFESGVIYAVKKTDASWRTKKTQGWVSILYKDNQLDLATSQGFDISKAVDFFVVDQNLLIRHKGNFESILNYKAGLQNDFAELSDEPDFISVFADLTVLTAFVGNNKIHLRRMSAVREKAHYKDPGFMERLRESAQKFGLTIGFDSEGKIIPSKETCRDIIDALLDHRLSSAFSKNIYSVPNTTAVPI